MSLVPSLTSMVCDFGLKDKIVGCTVFCIDPPDLRRISSLIGGTKDPSIEMIAELKPSHILVNQEENKPEHIAACQAIAPILNTFPKGPNDVVSLLMESAAWLGLPDEGIKWSARVKGEILDLAELRTSFGLAGKRYLYLIWREPYMVASSDTYIDAMLELLGLENAAPRASRYPSMNLSEVKEAAPDIVFFSSEPYPFRTRDMERFKKEWLEDRSLPGALPHLHKIDGKHLSWYGTKTVEGLRYLRDLGAKLA